MQDEQSRMRREIFNGCAYVSSNGQLVIDSHGSDEEHLTASQTRPSQPLYDCRKYVDTLFPKEWFGVPGKYVINYFTDSDDKIVAMTIIFTPASSSSAMPCAEQGDLPATSAR